MYDKNKANRLLKSFESNSINSRDLKTANLKASNLGKVASDFLTLIKIVNSSIKGEIKIDKKDLAIIIASIIYVVSPLDVIPDILPGGFVDDVGVVSMVLKSVYSLVREYKNWNNNRRIR